MATAMLALLSLIGLVLAIRHFLYLREMRYLKAIRTQWYKEVEERNAVSTSSFEDMRRRHAIELQQLKMALALEILIETQEDLREDPFTIYEMADYFSLELTKMEEDLEVTQEAFPELLDLSSRIKEEIESFRQSLWTLEI